MDRGVLRSAADLHLVPTVLQMGVEAADGGAQEDLLAESHVHRGGQMVVDLLGQGLQGEVQVVDVVDVVVGVDVPASRASAGLLPLPGMSSPPGKIRVSSSS